MRSGEDLQQGSKLSIDASTAAADSEDDEDDEDEDSQEPQSVLLSVDAENSSLIDPYNKHDHRRTGLFSGAVTADRIWKDPRREPIKHLQPSPLASQPLLPPIGNRTSSPLKASAAMKECPVRAAHAYINPPMCCPCVYECD